MASYSRRLVTSALDVMLVIEDCAVMLCFTRANDGQVVALLSVLCKAFVLFQWIRAGHLAAISISLAQESKAEKVDEQKSTKKTFTANSLSVVNGEACRQRGKK